jgi:uncharacterized protein (TIGR00251 family)
MFLRVRVVPRAGRNLVKEENGRLKVFLTQPAQDGKANAQLIEALAAHLGVKRHQLRICRGEKGRDKAVEVSAG